MPNVENELRQAMIEETSGLGVPSELAHQVVRRADRRRRSRRTTVALAAGVVLAAAVPGYLGVIEVNGAVSSTQTTEVGGVQVGYLPSDLGAPMQEKVHYGEFPGTRRPGAPGTTWSASRSTVPSSSRARTRAHAGQAQESVDALRSGRPDAVRGREGFIGPERRSRLGGASGLVLRVTVGTQHRRRPVGHRQWSRARRITGGVFEDLHLTYLPPACTRTG